MHARTVTLIATTTPSQGVTKMQVGSQENSEEVIPSGLGGGGQSKAFAVLDLALGLDMGGRCFRLGKV